MGFFCLVVSFLFLFVDCQGVTINSLPWISEEILDFGWLNNNEAVKEYGDFWSRIECILNYYGYKPIRRWNVVVWMRIVSIDSYNLKVPFVDSLEIIRRYGLVKSFHRDLALRFPKTILGAYTCGKDVDFQLLLHCYAC